MKASELRICNLIFTHKEEIIVVKGIDTEGLILFKEDQNIFDFKCKPIPLTEEWLFKLGFKKVYETCYQYKDFEINDKFIMMDIDITVQLKYVHSLQNLYFALTGEELTIKN